MSEANHPTPDPNTCDHGVPLHEECDRCWHDHRVRVDSRTSNPKTVKPPYDVALPKITAEIWEAYQDEEFIEDLPRWGWTQAAVDFACEIVRPAIWAEIERLAREYAHYADCLRKQSKLLHEVQNERDRLAASAEIDAMRQEISRLRAGLQQVRAILRSDSVEYDDLRNIDQIIETALSGEPASKTEKNDG